MITNHANLPISIAIWLMHDSYDHNPSPDNISVTALLKPLKSLVLTRRLPLVKDKDLIDLVPSSTGTAFHTAIETAWTDVQKSTFRELGYSDEMIDRIVINPGKVEEGDIPIYMEKRSSKKVGEYWVSGKFDFVIEERIEDFKSTSVWGFIFQSNKEDYIMQGSMYRWLNQDIIKDDVMNITYIFTDWSGTKAKQDSTYPQARIVCQEYPLLSLAETEAWVTSAVELYDKLKDAPQSALPDCTPKELWQKDAVWKYYKDPTKKTRSTKNFTDSGSAHARLAADGGVGQVVEVPGEVKRCNYCNAHSVCTQREALELSGALKP